MNEYFRYTLKDLEEGASQKKFNYITFFAGGGGSSCAYKLVGGDCKYMNEFQQLHVDTYLQNFPNTTHECKDIKQVTGKGIMELTGLGVGEIDILDASPPCPPFSMAGTKREGWNKEKIAYGMKQENIEDLTWEVIRITGELKPKVVICENVKGLTMDYARDHLNKMISDFEAEGYSAVYKVMNGARHGVPQKRERLIIIGARNDLNHQLNFPAPIDVDISLKNIVKFDMEGTIQYDYSELGIPEECIIKDMDNEEEPRNPHPYLVSKVNADLDKRTYKGKSYDDLMSFSKRDSPIHCEIIDIRNPAKTIICSYDHQPRFFVPIKNKKGTFIRALLPDELKQIQGFPADFEIVGNLKQKIVQIGNAVPPPLVKAVVESLVN